MGVDEDGKYIVHIREVVTIFHGTSRAITMDTTPNVDTTSIDTDLIHRKIDTLRLSSCNNGNTQDDQNDASRFMKWGTIGEVYAWDGRSSYIISGELAFVLPATV